MTEVITIAREYGSGASSISRMLADRLGWRLLDHEAISELVRAAQSVLAGRAAGLPDPWSRQLVQRVAWNVRAQPMAGGEEIGLRSLVIEEAASMADCILMGRGAQCILHRYGNVFNIFLYAPLELRLERSAQLLDPQVDVEAIVEEHDRAQAAFVREHFGQAWRDPSLYQLMLDTRYGYRAAADAIFAAAGFRAAAAGF